MRRVRVASARMLLTSCHTCGSCLCMVGVHAHVSGHQHSRRNVRKGLAPTILPVFRPGLAQCTRHSPPSAIRRVWVPESTCGMGWQGAG